MPRYATVAPHLTPDELGCRYRHAHELVARPHWHLLWRVAQGHHVPEAARLVGYTGNWAGEIVRRDNAGGPEAMAEARQHSQGHPPLLSPALREDLRQALADPPPAGGLWTCATVAAWMAERLGRPVGEPRGWEAFKKGGSAPRLRRSGRPIPPRS